MLNRTIKIREYKNGSYKEYSITCFLDPLYSMSKEQYEQNIKSQQKEIINSLIFNNKIRILSKDDYRKLIDSNLSDEEINRLLNEYIILINDDPNPTNNNTNSKASNTTRQRSRAKCKWRWKSFSR